MAAMHCNANFTCAFECIKIFATYLSPRLLTFAKGRGAAVKIPGVLQKGDGPGDSVRTSSSFSEQVGPASSDDSTPPITALEIINRAQVKCPPHLQYGSYLYTYFYDSSGSTREAAPCCLLSTTSVQSIACFRDGYLQIAHMEMASARQKIENQFLNMTNHSAGICVCSRLSILP
jgi:hypothetical protein